MPKKSHASTDKLSKLPSNHSATVTTLLCCMTLDSKRCKTNISNLFKEAMDQYIQDPRQVFQVWHSLCSELMSM